MPEPYDKAWYNPLVPMPGTFQQIDDLDPALGLTVPTGARAALISCEGADIRWTDDGTTPTAAVGHLLQTDATMVVYGSQQLSAIRFFETGATAVLSASYYR